MKALVTGASSGIGREISIYLDSLGYSLFLVSRNKDELESLKKQLKNPSKIIVMDLSDLSNLKSLYVLLKNEKIDILVNNAGYGLHGEFSEINFSSEMNMIDLNVKAVHILTKLFLKDMKKRNSGYILNVASIAGLLPAGPLMATYYATKSYVASLTRSINSELKKDKSNVHISCLCPGPVDTNFSNRANVKFLAKGLNSKFVAKYAIDNLLKRKSLIIPGFYIKMLRLFSKFIPESLLINFIYHGQKNKNK